MLHTTNADAEASKIQYRTGGEPFVRKLIGITEAWKKEGREVDIVEISADNRGGAMSAVVDGIVLFAEVHGK